ncbi:MAG: NFACT family protein, partial [Candidatus Enteromonas sp.]|nr:NFACT family protein [Candidatus Enteromonas sp.]
MALSSIQLALLAKRLDEILAGQYLSKCVQISENAWSFATSKSGRLLINVDSGDPYVALLDTPLTLTGLPTPISSYFRSKLSHAKILGVSTYPGERIIRFSLRTTNEIFEEQTVFLIVELIPHHANLLLLDETDTILIAKRYSSLSDSRILLKGGRYELPAPFVAKKEIPSELDIEAYFLEAKEKERALFEARKNFRFQSLVKTLKTKQKAVERKIDNILKDIDAASAHLQDGEYGQFIFTYLDSLRPEDGEMDYYGTRVALDPKKSLIQNAEAFFARAKKAKTTIARSQEFLALAEKERERYALLLDALSHSEESALEQLAGEFQLQGKENDIIQKSPLGDKASLPYKVEIDGTSYWFGKNAIQNDCLSFLYATKKERLWFHVKNAHGAHLILQKDNPSNEEVFTACCLTLLASKKEDGEVQYTPHKYVKRGNVPG